MRTSNDPKVTYSDLQWPTVTLRWPILTLQNFFLPIPTSPDPYIISLILYKQSLIMKLRCIFDMTPPPPSSFTISSPTLPDTTMWHRRDDYLNTQSSCNMFSMFSPNCGNWYVSIVRYGGSHWPQSLMSNVWTICLSADYCLIVCPHSVASRTKLQFSSIPAWDDQFYTAL